MSHHRRDRHPRPSRTDGSNSRRVLGHAERVEINHAPLSDADAEQLLMWQNPVWPNHDMTAGRGATLYFSSRMTTVAPGWDSHGAGTSDPVFSNGAYYAHLPSQTDSFSNPTWQASSASHATGSYGAHQVATSPTASPAEPPSTGTEETPYDDRDGFGPAPHYGDGPGGWLGSTAPDGIGVADYDMNSMSIGRRWSIQARQGSNGDIHYTAQHSGAAAQDSTSPHNHVEDSDGSGSEDSADQEAHGEYVRNCMDANDPWSSERLKYNHQP